MSAAKCQYYATPDEAAQAATKKLRTKYGSGPQVFIFRSPEGFGFSTTKPTRVMKRSTVLIIPERPNYFREALKAIIGRYPPILVPPYGTSEMGDEVIDLQDWCSDNAQPSWATGLSMIEAAELIVIQALDNDNIKRV
jgi:hypothetical protein